MCHYNCEAEFMSSSFYRYKPPQGLVCNAETVWLGKSRTYGDKFLIISLCQEAGGKAYVAGHLDSYKAGSGPEMRAEFESSLVDIWSPTFAQRLSKHLSYWNISETYRGPTITEQLLVSRIVRCSSSFKVGSGLLAPAHLPGSCEGKCQKLGFHAGLAVSHFCMQSQHVLRVLKHARCRRQR